MLDSAAEVVERASCSGHLKSWFTRSAHELARPEPFGESANDERNFLRRLSDEEAKGLEGRSERKNYQRGAVLFRQGDSGDDIFILRSGRVKVCVQREGREVILAVFDAGALLGELSAVDGSS